MATTVSVFLRAVGFGLCRDQATPYEMRTAWLAQQENKNLQTSQVSKTCEVSGTQRENENG
jgi:hypothetical protein